MTFFAGGFLYNPDRQSVLLHLRDTETRVNPGQWAFFGGTSEKGETPAATFIREMNEELGVKLLPTDVIPLVNYWNPDRQTHRHVFYAVSRIAKERVQLTEGESFGWIDLKKVFSYDLTEKTVRDLRSFIEQLQANESPS